MIVDVIGVQRFAGRYENEQLKSKPMAHTYLTRCIRHLRVG